MKLVLTYSWGDISCSGTSYIPFEYESKEKFVFDVLEKYKDYAWKVYEIFNEKYYEEVEIFPNVYLNKFDIDSIEHHVCLLDDWFNENKIEIII